MRNWKVGRKLVIGFCIVELMAVLVGVTGIIGMQSMGSAAHDMYAEKATPMASLLTAADYFQRQRVQVLNAIICAGNAQELQALEGEMRDRISVYEAAMETYRQSLAVDKGKALFAEISELYEKTFKPGILKVLENAKLGMPQEQLYQDMNTTTDAANRIAACLSELGGVRLGIMQAADEDNDSLRGILFLTIILAIVFTLQLGTVTATYVSRSIRIPLGALTRFMRLAGETGDISISDEEQHAFDKYGQYKDEVGQCMANTSRFVKHIDSISKGLEAIADGDLSADIKLLSDKDGMGRSMKKMADGLNDMFAEVRNATVQVSVGSKQVAEGSQALAQGSTEQAAAVEQLSSSIAEIAQKTKGNADMADKAADMAETIKQSAQKGSRQMGEMMEAVKDINQASQSIGKVIKVIDDIAFQTNILALNAAVEAARAGQHGKGFAVVAEEVRNLASKSSEAAKDTGALIANSMEKAELGSRIAVETADSLTEIVSGINESGRLIEDIARSSEEQSQGITQINKGIDQVTQVIQQNSATAEESASASEEMSGQSAMLEDLIRRFRLRDDSAAHMRAQSAGHDPAQKRLRMTERPMHTIYSGGNEFGKY